MGGGEGSGWRGGGRATPGTRLTLEVRESNAAARALYESFEMKVVGERARYYRDGETALVYGATL